MRRIRISKPSVFSAKECEQILIVLFFLMTLGNSTILPFLSLPVGLGIGMRAVLVSGGVAPPRGLPGTSPPRDGERSVSSRDSNAHVRQGCREDQMEMG